MEETRIEIGEQKIFLVLDIMAGPEEEEERWSESERVGTYTKK